MSDKRKFYVGPMPQRLTDEGPFDLYARCPECGGDVNLKTRMSGLHSITDAEDSTHTCENGHKHAFSYVVGGREASL
jgi:hypothetical protein